jgi:WD40 repeat protein
VWEVATRKKLWATKNIASSLSDAPFLKDGHSLVCTIADGRLAVLDARDGALLESLGRGANIASTIAVSPDGRRLAAGTWSSEVLLTDLSTSHTRVLTNHGGPVRGVAFSPDGRQLASGSDDYMVKLWDVESGAEQVSLRGHGKGIASLVYSADGRRLFTGGRDGTVRAWDTQAKPTPSTTILPAGFFGVPMLPNGRVDETLSLPGFRSLSRDGRFLAACSTNGLRRVLSLETFDQIGEVQSSGRFRCISIRPDGREIAAGMTNGTVSVWDLVEGKVSWTFQAHSNEVDVLEFSPDGRRLATASRGAEIRVWNRGESRPVFTRILGGTGYHVNEMVFSHDSSTLVVPRKVKYLEFTCQQGFT